MFAPFPSSLLPVTFRNGCQVIITWLSINYFVTSGKKKKTRRRGSGKPKKRDITLNNVDSDASFSDGEVEILEGDELVSRGKYPIILNICSNCLK